ncbi:MAG: iron hydrogenase small subunit [Clostridium sp.]
MLEAVKNGTLDLHFIEVTCRRAVSWRRTTQALWIQTEEAYAARRAATFAHDRTTYRKSHENPAIKDLRRIPGRANSHCAPSS